MSDVFDQDADELTENKNEFNRIMENIEKEGLVEGIEEGKQKVVQDGFNKGYEIAFKYFYKINLLKGVISVQKNEQAGQLKTINESLTKLEEQMMNSLEKNKKEDLDEPFNSTFHQIKDQLKETNLFKDVEEFFRDEETPNPT